MQQQLIRRLSDLRGRQFESQIRRPLTAYSQITIDEKTLEGLVIQAPGLIEEGLEVLEHQRGTGNKALLDHGIGEGMYAELFCASMESAAFVESDIIKLIEIGLSYIPVDCGIAKAVKTAIDSFNGNKSWLEARDTILELYRGKLASWATVSERDTKKGFADGKLGYDAPSNIGILVLALLYGKGDFSETLCIAVNCGEDTDCTAATAGSLLGIIHGTRGIPDKWIAPIGRGIKTISLNLGDLGHFGSFVPQTVDNLTTRTEKIALKVLEKYARNNVSIVENEKSAIVAIANDLKADTSTFSLSNGGLTSTYRYPFYEIKVAYEGGVFVEQGKEKLVKVTIIPKYRVSAVLNLHWYLPDGMLTVPTHDKQVVVAPNQQQIIQTAINVNFLTKSTTRGALEISIDGRPSVMLVPLIFISAAMAT